MGDVQSPAVVCAIVSGDAASSDVLGAQCLFGLPQLQCAPRASRGEANSARKRKRSHPLEYPVKRQARPTRRVMRVATDAALQALPHDQRHGTLVRH